MGRSRPWWDGTGRGQIVPLNSGFSFHPPLAGPCEAPTQENAMLTTQSPSAAGSRVTDLPTLPLYRLNLMRVGYLVMGVGIAIVRWPDLVQAASISTFEAVVVSMLTAMSLLAFLGLRYPTKMLPILVFESAWKLLWLAAVAVPRLLADDLDAPTEKLFSSIVWVVLILAVTPWDYVWRAYVTAPAERVRRPAR
jgi:hypothetical protein